MTTSDVSFDGDGPGEHWQRVGTIDTSVETDLATHLQVLLGHRKTAPAIDGFYLKGDPENPWVQAAKQDPAGQQPFWLAIDPWGTMKPQIYGANETYFVSAEKGTATKSLLRREPKPHPSEVTKPVMIGIRIRINRNAGGLIPKRERSSR